MSLYLYIMGALLAYCLFVQVNSSSPLRRSMAIGFSLTWPVSLPILLMIAMVQS